MKDNIWGLYRVSNEKTGLEAGVCFRKVFLLTGHAPHLLPLPARLLGVPAFAGPCPQLGGHSVLQFVSTAPGSMPRGQNLL